MIHPARITLMGALLLSGCFSLSRKSPPVERFVLGGIRATPTSTLPNDSLGLSIGMRRLELSPYLSTLAIVVRRAGNEIVTSGFHRWAESPSAGLNRAVSGYLAMAPGIRSVDVAPWPVRTKQDYIVQLHVERMEGVASSAREGEAQLLARWEIIHPDDGALLARGRTDYRAAGWAVGDYGDLVTRIDQGLLALTQELVTCLARVRAGAIPQSAAARNSAIECGMRAGDTR